jgi:hypothetical protein
MLHDSHRTKRIVVIARQFVSGVVLQSRWFDAEWSGGGTEPGMESPAAHCGGRSGVEPWSLQLILALANRVMLERNAV